MWNVPAMWLTIVAAVAFCAGQPCIAARPSAGDIAAGSGDAQTLRNLQVAYNGESNAHARYLTFAQKAKEESYPEVAALFTAAAHSEQIHANNHAAVIREMGGRPQMTLDQPVVRSTRENLQAALKGETFERDTLYPGFLDQARATGNRRAIRTFNFAKATEAEHARLYAAMLDAPSSWSGTDVSYYVCPVCGNTVDALTFARCPVCSTPKGRFQRFRPAAS